MWGGMPFRKRQMFARFLKKRNKGEIPNGEEVIQEELHFFLLAEEKRKNKKRVKAKTIKPSGAGIGSITPRLRSVDGTGRGTSSHPSSANRTDTGRRSGGGSTYRAANAAGRKKDLPRRG